MSRPRALAIGAHPDDIEFRMAGTLLRLKTVGWEIHYLNLSTGNCGSAQYGPAETARRRGIEARRAAELLGAVWHPPFCRDLEIFYTHPNLRRLGGIVREIGPAVVLTHPPVDYMEDHTETCRLAVTAVFSRGMPNFKTHPDRPIHPGEVTLYHCTPHGLVDPMGVSTRPPIFVDTTEVHAAKIRALAAHESQQDWLDRSQAMNQYLQAADDESRQLGTMSGKFIHAEGWWRHAHTGFCARGSDPICAALGRHHHSPI